MIFNEIRPGQSVEGSKIQVFKSHFSSERYFYLIAGVHGDEVEGVYVLDKLFHFLKEIEGEIPLIIVPIQNIDGYRAGTRENAHGVDLNRNFTTKDWSPEFQEKKYFPGKSALSEPENQHLVSLFDKFPPLLLISFHSWKPMLNYNGDCKNIAEFISEYNQYPVVPSVGYPTPGSLGTFLPDKYQAPVLTYELPTISKMKTLQAIWEENREGLCSLFENNEIFQLLK